MQLRGEKDNGKNIENSTVEILTIYTNFMFSFLYLKRFKN